MKRTVLVALFSLTLYVLRAQAPAIPTAAHDSLTLKTNTHKTNNSKAAKPSAKNITDNIAGITTFSKFYNALRIAGLTETFKSRGPITVFIPDDNAFGKMPAGKLDTLLKPAHLPELIAMLSYHAVAGKLTSRDIEKQIHAGKNKAVFTTLAGSKFTAKIDEGNNIVLTSDNGGQSTITRLNVEQSNGELFIVDTVLVPKNKLF